VLTTRSCRGEWTAHAVSEECSASFTPAIYLCLGLSGLRMLDLSMTDPSPSSAPALAAAPFLPSLTSLALEGTAMRTRVVLGAIKEYWLLTENMQRHCHYFCHYHDYLLLFPLLPLPLPLSQPVPLPVTITTFDTNMPSFPQVYPTARLHSTTFYAAASH
jgi:hypothetical protein